MTAHIVIVGAGQAGLKVAETLRRNGVTDPITMIGEEPHLPYQRPPLSKKFLLGMVDRPALWLQHDAFFTTNHVEFLRGRKVIAIESGQDRVRLDDGTMVGFSRLVLATGSRARQLTLPGADKTGIHVVRTLDDAETLHARLPATKRAVIVGGGYVGLETAASLRSAGIAVTVLEMQERLLARAACPVVAAHLARVHRGHGVDIRLGVGVDRILGGANVQGVALKDGTVIEADVIVSAVGGVPNEDLAAEAGISCDSGICVDVHGATSRPNVFAAGDCTRFPSRRYRRTLRLESVQNANDQARAVADAIAGKPVVYDPVPWFWSDQYDMKLQMAGIADGTDEARIEGDPDGGAFAVTYWREGRMLAVSAVNSPRAYMAGRRALEAQPVVAEA